MSHSWRQQSSLQINFSKEETEMSAKMMSSLTNENRDMRKQIRCMSIFHLFDRHQWRLSSHNHKRLLLGPQCQLEPHNATKAIIGKDLELRKEKPRVTPKSSQASDSLAFSSRDYHRTNVSESPFHSSSYNLQSSDIRDVVKDSMYREARGLSIKSHVNGARKVTVMKHIDSPRPLQQPKTTVCEGSPHSFCKVQEGIKRSNDERMTLHRFSYDGRELRDTFKTTMKIKELPRLSLDSKTSSMKCSYHESRLNPRNENSSQVVPLNQEQGSHSRSNSIVTKLMGLDDFPDTGSTDEGSITKIKSSPSPSPRAALSSPVSEKNPASSSPRMHNGNTVRKPTTCSRLPMEQAPWKPRDLQASPKMAAQSKKAPVNNTSHSSSIYSEIEKRITELEFKRSGKDLRALKQILEAMKKKREMIENHIEESAEVTLPKSCSNPNPNLSMWQNRKTYQHDQTIKGTSTTNGITNLAKVIEKVKTSSSNQIITMEAPHLQRIQIQDQKYHRKNQALRQTVKDITPRNNMKEPSRRVPCNDKRTTLKKLEVERTLRAPQPCTTSGRRFGPVSPRFQQNVLGIEGKSRPNNPSSNTSTVKKLSSKHVREKSSQNRRHNVKPIDLQSSDDQLSELSSELRQSSYQSDTASIKSESNDSAASHIETEVISSANSVKTNSRQKQDFVTTSKEHVSEIEHTVTMMEQPSPVSVLDATFYSEDSPSPIKKKSTAFQDESPSPDEAEWHLENINHLTDCTISDPGYRHNQTSEKMLNVVHEARLLKTKHNETAANQNESVHQSVNPDEKYITKILLASGLLEDTKIIPTANLLLSSCRLMSPDMFHALEETEDYTGEANAELIKKSDWIKINQKIQRKLIFDTVNEITVRKITSSGFFTRGRKRMSPQGLMKEIYSEMDHLCRMPHHTLDDEDDVLIGLLNADMKHQSDDWTEYSAEFPSLVLDIERLIFKDLISEIVTGEVVVLHDLPKRHCRQLFA